MGSPPEVFSGPVTSIEDRDRTSFPVAETHTRTDFIHKNRWQLIAFVSCVLFGIAMIANANGAADGTWIWYGILFNKGIKLYSDLHLVQQPFFVLETAWFLSLLGKSWIATKIPAILHVLIYTLGLSWIARYIPLSDSQRGLLVGASYLLSVNTVAFRFDDYHVVAESCAVYSVVALLAMYRSTSTQRIFMLSAALGILAALAIETRITNGAALFLATAILIAAIARKKKLAAAAVFCSATAVAILLLVHATGDRFSAYWRYSIGEAAGSKGGTGGVLENPIALPWNALTVLRPPRFTAFVLMFIFACWLWGFVIAPGLRRREVRSLSLAILGLLPFAAMIGYAYNRGLRDFAFLYVVTTLGVFLLYALGLAAVVGLILHLSSAEMLPEWKPLQLFVLIPWAHLAAGAMSAAGLHGEYYAPLGLLLLLLPIAYPSSIGSYGRPFLLSAAALLLCHCFVRRVQEPYRWLGFQAKPMFTGRQWYVHPVYGPMLMEHDLLAFVQPICDQISEIGSNRELLSSPYSYANYFCDITPWHNYVQTWYDTTNAATMQALRRDLESAPPQWILYQNQPAVVHMDEMEYHGGHTTPHGKLAEFIDQQVESGAWKVSYKSGFGSTGVWNERIDQQWLLIRTR